MISISINDEHLEIPDDITVKFKRKSNIYELDFQGSLYSSPFNIYASPRNRKILGHLGELDAAQEDQKEFICTLWIQGNPEIKGILVLNDFAEDKISCVFQSDFGRISPDILGLSLRDLNLGGDLVIPENRRYSVAGFQFDNSEIEYDITLGSTTYTNKDTTALSTVQALIDDINADGANNAEARYIGTYDFGGGDEIVILIQSDTDYSTDPDPITYDPNLSATEWIEWDNDSLGAGIMPLIQHIEARLVWDDNAINLYEIVFGTFPYQVAPIYNPDFFSTDFNTYELIMNMVDPAASINSLRYLERLQTGTQSEFPGGSGPLLLIQIHHILKTVMDLADLRLMGDFMDDDEMATLMLVGFFDQVKRHPDDTAPGAFFSGTLNLENDMPEMSVKTFIEELKKLFCLGFFYDLNRGTLKIQTVQSILESEDYDDWDDIILDKTLKITANNLDKITFDFERDTSDNAIETKFKPIENLTLQSSVANVAALPASGNSTGDIRLVEDINHYYIWGAGGVGWEYHSDAQHKKVVGSGENALEITTALCPPMMVKDVDLTEFSLGTITQLMPHIGIEGSSPRPDYTEKFEPPGPKVVFYRGLQEDGSNHKYPLASMDIYDYDGDAITGANYAIRWDEDRGLYNTFYKAWATWRLSTRRVKAKAKLTAADFFRRDLSRIVRYKNRKLIIDEIQLTISAGQIGVADVTLYTK
jgi:hypothetical protein